VEWDRPCLPHESSVARMPSMARNLRRGSAVDPVAPPLPRNSRRPPERMGWERAAVQRRPSLQRWPAWHWTPRPGWRVARARTVAAHGSGVPRSPSGLIRLFPGRASAQSIGAAAATLRHKRGSRWAEMAGLEVAPRSRSAIQAKAGCRLRLRRGGSDRFWTVQEVGRRALFDKASAGTRGQPGGPGAATHREHVARFSIWAIFYINERWPALWWVGEVVSSRANSG